jgi:hypothetical protein
MSPSQPNNTPNPPSDRPYQWNTLELNVQLRWQPNQPGTSRQVLITATSYDDFPVAILVDETELGELPPLLQTLLSELKQALPVRQLRYQQAQAKTKPKPASRTPPPSLTPSTRTKPDTPAPEPPPTQIALF